LVYKPGEIGAKRCAAFLALKAAQNRSDAKRHEEYKKSISANKTKKPQHPDSFID
jgi:hypothetical protein